MCVSIFIDLLVGHAGAGEVVAPDGGVDHERDAENGVHAAGVGHHGVGAAQEACVAWLWVECDE